MIEIVRSYINDGIGLIQIGAVLVAGFVVLAAWTKTKSATATVGAMVLGALVIGFVMNAEWLGQKTGEDITRRENGLGAQVIDEVAS